MGICLVVVLWKILVHIYWRPILAAPLYPGILVHAMVTGPRGGTLAQERIGFVFELATNVLAYGLVANVLFRLVTKSN
jgi:hypothetical protein